MTADRRAAAVLGALLTGACGAPLMKLPAGPGVPAADVPEAVAQATRACRAVTSLTAEIAVRGSAGRRRLRGRLHVGVAPAAARIEAVATFGPVFVFVATGDDATLLLTRENRVLEHERPDAVLEAVTGVPIGPATLWTTLTGCAAAPAVGEGRQLGADWRMVRDGYRELYLRRDSAAGWRLVAAVHDEPDRPVWRAEFRDFQDDRPHSIRLTSRDRDRFDLRLALAQVEINMPLGAEVFQVKIPPTADPITLDELRRGGPLADATDERPSGGTSN